MYSICGPLLLLYNLFDFLLTGILSVSTFLVSIDVMLFHMAFDRRPLYNPVTANQAPVLLICRAAYHFEKAQLQKQIRLIPDLISEAADRHFVHEI